MIHSSCQLCAAWANIQAECTIIVISFDIVLASIPRRVMLSQRHDTSYHFLNGVCGGRILVEVQRD
jgi:hypothetical protein